jgi:hypothetical protein
MPMAAVEDSPLGWSFPRGQGVDAGHCAESGLTRGYTHRHRYMLLDRMNEAAAGGVIASAGSSIDQHCLAAKVFDAGAA